jgi:hypothetical protein
MKNVLTSPSGMKATGVGPKIILVTLPFVAAGIVLHTYLPEYSRFSSVYPAVLIRTGMALTGVGASFYLAAMVQFLQDLPPANLNKRSIRLIQESYLCQLDCFSPAGYFPHLQ